MPLQYLKDSDNNTTAVVIPIRDWEQITQIHEDINLMLQHKTSAAKKLRPSDYRGFISKETADKLNTLIEQSRNKQSKKISTSDKPTKSQILRGIKQAVKEINLVKAGKLKAKDARNLINEL